MELFVIFGIANISQPTYPIGGDLIVGKIAELLPNFSSLELGIYVIMT